MTKHYPDEFKADVVEMALRGEVPKRRIAEDVGISETTLFRWINRFGGDQQASEGAGGEEAEELARLRRDKRRLEQENEILRRAAAYFAKDALPK